MLSAFAAEAQITAAVAANVQFAMEKMRSDFRQKTGIEVKAVYGSSGKLTTQIRHGAPFDLFISADTEYPDSLYAWKYAATAPKVYAYGKLVLWTTRDIDLSQGLGLLSGASVTQIAIADPRHAPYGREAIKAMQRAGVYEQAKAKMVYGENISQVSQYILSGHADIGFNAKSVVLADKATSKGKWIEVDTTLYDRLAQGAIITQYGEKHHAALSRQFFDYLESDAARQILSEYGYVLP